LLTISAVLLLMLVDLVILLFASSSVWLIALSTRPEAFRRALIQLFLTFDVTDDRLSRLLSQVYTERVCNEREKNYYKIIRDSIEMT
jgi:hypothetical protein